MRYVVFRGLKARANRKQVLAIVLIFGFLIGLALPFLPSIEGQTDGLTVDKDYWLQLATNAWNYFQPGVGVDPVTGLHSSGLSYPYFTDWDLGNYIQAIIDVNELGILSSSGTWGSDARFNKILTFLETRSLGSNAVPYATYQSADGTPYGNVTQVCTDAGELLMSLNNLRIFRPDLAGAINYIVYNRTNYAPLKQEVDALASSTDIGDFHTASGFACFWPIQFSSLATNILNNILTAPTVTTYGAKLPVSSLMCEPLLLSVFNLPPNADLEKVADLSYLAQDARYNATGKFTAFSEGNTGLDNPSYIYEWIVNETGSTWTITDIDGQPQAGISPIIYFKAAVGLLAMFNTSYTENMVSSVESKLPSPTNGYCDGIDENGRVVTTVIDKTNSMIIQAAEYAINTINSDQNSTPTPSPSPTLSPSPTSAPSPTTYSSPTPTRSLNPTQSPSSKPTPTQSISLTASPTTPTASPTINPTPSSLSAPNIIATPSQSTSSTPSVSLTAPPSSEPSSQQTSQTQPPTQSPTASASKKESQLNSDLLYYILIIIMFIGLATSAIVLPKKKQ